MKTIPRESASKPVSELLLLTGFAVALAVALPLLGVVAFATRGVLVAAAVVLVLGGALLYAVSPAFRGWFNAEAEGEVIFGGLRLATDVALSPAHSWARWEGDVAHVGADDLMQTVFGPVAAVDLPPAGQRVRRGEPLFTLRRGSRRLPVPSPVSGSVVGFNPSLPWQPVRVNESPFGSGWVVRMKAGSPRLQQRSLLRGGAAREWFRGEVERLRTALLGAGEPAMSLPDGGVLVEDLHRQIDEAAWEGLVKTFFTDETAAEAEGLAPEA